MEEYKMERSESIKTILPKLLIIQKKIENVTKDNINPFHHSKYAGLPDIIDACKKHINDEGMIVTQVVTSKEGKDYLETLIIDVETCEYVGSFAELKDVKNMQSMGSSITYLRRYALQSLLFMSAVDDDAESTMDRPTQKPMVVQNKPISTFSKKKNTEEKKTTDTQEITEKSVTW
jgi:hypothetical protein